jgi:hypothetical protein
MAAGPVGITWYEGFVTREGGAVSRMARMSERTDVICLGWWTQGGPLLSTSGLRRLVDDLHDVLPEAIPSRWDVSEDYRYRLADAGLDGLVEFVDSHRWDLQLRAKAPARRIQLYPVPPSMSRGELRVTSLQVELDASVLDKRGADRRLPDAFERIGAVVEPFYGEARFMRGVARHEGSPLVFHPSVDIYPFRSNAWWGLPIKAPFAAMLGSPYRELWTDFGNEEVAGLAVDNRRPWHRTIEALRWSVPPGLCQLVDPHWAQQGPAAWQLATPSERPPTWPFPSELPDITPDPFELLARLTETGDGQVRRVAVDDPDGEPFEAWERVSPGRSQPLSVYVRKTPDPEWTWSVTVAA